jgi:hypothetical protein
MRGTILALLQAAQFSFAGSWQSRTELEFLPVARNEDRSTLGRRGDIRCGKHRQKKPKHRATFIISPTARPMGAAT